MLYSCGTTISWNGNRQTSVASASSAFCRTKSGNLTSCSLTSTYRHYVCILCQHLTALQYLLLICCYTLSRPPTISSLKTTDRSFRYASPCLWNQLPDSFRQPHHSRLDSVTTIVYPGHLRSWSMRQFFRIGPRIDSHKGNFF